MLLVAAPVALVSVANCRQILEIRERDVDAGESSGDASSNDAGDGLADGDAPDAADGDAPCPYDVCGLAAPQCGCPPGQGCHGSPVSGPYCGATGVKTEGEECQSGECLPGYGCAPMFGSCAKYCEKTLDCGEHRQCRDYPYVGHQLFRFCTPNCDLVTSEGCPSGTKCNDVANAIFECGPIGTVSENGACLSDDDCASGLMCWGSPPTDAVCRRWCHVGADECSCDLYLNLPNVDGKEYGICSIFN